MKWMAGFLLRGCYVPVLLHVKDPKQVKGKKNVWMCLSSSGARSVDSERSQEGVKCVPLWRRSH